MGIGEKKKLVSKKDIHGYKNDKWHFIADNSTYFETVNWMQNLHAHIYKMIVRQVQCS